MKSDLSVISFAAARQPQYRETRGENGGYIEFGDADDYPEYLLRLFDGSPKHNAIIRGKVTYISGNGWTTRGAGSAAADAFIARVNGQHSLYELTTRLAFDLEVFGSAYIQVIWTRWGRSIASLHHVDYASVRTNRANTHFWYKPTWAARGTPPIILPAYDPENLAPSQILMLRQYRPGQQAYGLPGYLGCLNYLEADMEVSRHVLNNAQNGFTGSTHITFYEGPDANMEHRREVERLLRQKFSGPEGHKIIVGFAPSRELKPDIENIGVSDLTRENFGMIDQLLQENIFAGHQVTTPSIFGISQSGRFGNSTEMRDGYEIFKSTYANARQLFIEDAINRLAVWAGVSMPLQIVPVDPISMFDAATIASAMSREEIREKAGLPREQPAPESASQTPQTTPL